MLTHRFISNRQYMQRISPEVVLRNFERRCLRTRSRVETGGFTVSGSDTIPVVIHDEQRESKEPSNDVGTAWRSLLEIPARAAWRATAEEKPEILLNAQHDLIRESNRSPKQLQWSYHKIITNHAGLAQRREKERRRLVKDPNGVEGPTLRTEPLADPILYKPELTLASLRERLIPNFFVIRRVLQECQSLLGAQQFQPKRVIDFGIGFGSASAAALDVFDSVEWIHGVEPSRSMRDACERVLYEVINEIGSPTRLTFSANLSSEVNGSLNIVNGFDLVLIAYTATEIPQVNATLAAAGVLWEKLEPNGVLVMVEPGTPDGFNSIRAVREMLLETCPPNGLTEGPGESQCHIIAPCTHSGPCPMIRHKPGFVKPKKAASVAADSTQTSEAKTEATIDGQEVQRQTIEATAVPRNDGDSDDDESSDDDSSDDDGNRIIDVPSMPSTSPSHGRGSETGIFDASFCSFVHAIQGESSEKLTFLVAQKRVVPQNIEELKRDHPEREHNAFHDAKLSELLRKTQERGRFDSRLHHRAQELATQYLDSEDDDLGLELVRGEARSTFGRIVRAPIKKKGHVYIDYCAAPGRIVRTRVTKAANKAAPGIYAAARKSRWGGVWPDTLGSDTPDDSDLNELSMVHHEIVVATPVKS